MKTCFKCNETKPMDEFYRHPQMGDGHLNKCKACTRKDTAARFAIKSLDPEWLEREAERHRLKAKRMREAGRWPAQNKERRREALKRYRETDAHHDDHSRPLDVRWLCRRHHAEADNELRSMRRRAAFNESQ